MKIIIEDDGCKEISVIQKEKVSYPWEGKHCGECRYFHRHYALIDSDNNSYCPLPHKAIATRRKSIFHAKNISHVMMLALDLNRMNWKEGENNGQADF